MAHAHLFGKVREFLILFIIFIIKKNIIINLIIFCSLQQTKVVVVVLFHGTTCDHGVAWKKSCRRKRRNEEKMRNERAEPRADSICDSSVVGSSSYRRRTRVSTSTRARRMIRLGRWRGIFVSRGIRARFARITWAAHVHRHPAPDALDFCHFRSDVFRPPRNWIRAHPDTPHPQLLLRIFYQPPCTYSGTGLKGLRRTTIENRNFW